MDAWDVLANIAAERVHLSLRCNACGVGLPVKDCRVCHKRK